MIFTRIKVPESHTQDILENLQLHQVELEQQNRELIRIQLELEKTKARYFDLFNLAPVGYVIVDKKNVILKANLTITELLEIPKKSLINQPLTNFLYKDDQDLFYLSRKKLLNTGENQKCDLRMIREKGTVLYIRLEMIADRDNCDLKSCWITVSDITEQKIALNKTLESEEKYRTLFDHDTNAIFICNPSNNQ